MSSSDTAKCLQGAKINPMENHGSGISSDDFSKRISKMGIKLAGFYMPSYQNVPLVYIFIWEVKCYQDLLLRSTEERKKSKNQHLNTNGIARLVMQQAPFPGGIWQKLENLSSWICKKILFNKQVLRGVISQVSITVIPCHDDVWFYNPDPEIISYKFDQLFPLRIWRHLWP